MGIFKANDIRGLYPEELTKEELIRIGKLLPSVLNVNRILIGRDARNSSIEIFDILSDAITSVGCDVIDIGLCDTPAIYFATYYYNFKGSVMITASHNPPAHNGLKISGAGSVPLGPENGLLRLRDEEIQEETNIEKGIIQFFSIENDYVKYLKRFINPSNNLKVVFDCSNGSAGAYVSQVFEAFDCEIINKEPDGNFPNHSPNPLDKESQVEISDRVVKTNADIGIIFDGDADRAIFIDENGRFVSPDIFTALIGAFVGKRQEGNVFYDARSSKSISEYIEKANGKSFSCKSGHAHIKQVMRHKNGIVAGELSGHYYYKDNYYCDSAFITAALVLDILASSGKTLSELVAAVNPYAFSGEINFVVKNPTYIIEEISKKFDDFTESSIEGIKLKFKDWWFMLRISGAEKVLRLVVECDNHEELQERIDEVSEAIYSLDA